MFNPHDPTFWVLISFALFIGLLLYYSVPRMIGSTLDARADAIRSELDEARRLREEAEALLADYKTKALQAETEAKSIIEQAKRDAEALAKQSREALAETVARRAKMAEEKIARAESQAVAEVRASAVGVALTAAEKILKERTTGATATGLIEDSIRNLKGKLN